ncbi:MAG: hypothetical protein JWN87_1346 [Frankiales bacterium]|nr:hypothetical protein [Frankiales bacterium]
MTGHRRRTLSLVSLALVLWSTLSLGSAPVRADAIFNATADAAAVRTSFADSTVVPFLAEGRADFTSPRAQAIGNSLGTSTALASAMYPGDDIAGLGDLLGLFLPPSVPLTVPPVAFPLVVKADNGTPSPADASSPAYLLHARVDDAGAAEGVATSGASPVLAPGANSTSKAEVTTTADGGVRAAARTASEGFSLPGVLKIGAVTTAATAARSGSGALTRSSDMAMAGGAVLGLPLELRNGKFVIPVLGQSIAVEDAIQALPILAPLKERGVRLEFQAATTTPNGITAPGIRITWVQAVPAIPLPAVPLPPLSPGQPNIGPIPASTATVTYALGFASAQATLTSFPSISGPPDSSGPPTVTPPDTGVSVGDPAVPPALGVGQPPLLGSEGSPSVVPPTTAVPSARAQPRLVRSLGSGPDLADIYLVLVVAGLLAVGAGQLMRIQGVRTAQAI